MSMHCPFCAKKARCIDSREVAPAVVRRRYSCAGKKCKQRWTTYEQAFDGDAPAKSTPAGEASFQAVRSSIRKVVIRGVINELRRKLRESKKERYA